jgi:uncharacterized delta-60 repeat protein
MTCHARLRIEFLPGGKIRIGNQCKVGLQYGLGLVQFNANGSLDTSFDGDGKLCSAFTTASQFPFSMVFQSDGRIVGVGEIGGVAAVARYNANGTLDTSFGGGDGHVEFSNNTFWRDIALQSDRIVVVGRQSPGDHPLMVRYTSDGLIDPTFGSNGAVVETSVTVFGNGGFHNVEVQGDGKIVVAGGVDMPGQSQSSSDAFLAARYMTDGALDTSFSGGVVITDISAQTEVAWGLVIQADGRIISAGHIVNAMGEPVFAVVRYLGDDPPPLPPLRTPGTDSDGNAGIPPATDRRVALRTESTAPHNHDGVDFAIAPPPTTIRAPITGHAAAEWDALPWDWLSVADGVFSEPAK